MRTTILSGILLTLFGGALCTSASAQFTINIPNLPSLKRKPKTTTTPEPPTVTSTEATQSPAASTSQSTSTNDDAPATSVKKASCESDAFYPSWKENIEKTKDDVRSFTPGRGYFVHDFNDNHNLYMKMALSESYRQKEEKNWPRDGAINCINDRLDELRVLAEKAIGGYSPVGYTLGTPAEKATLRSSLSDINLATVYQVGIKNNQWTILSNEFGIPTYRRKFGALWLKYPGDTYCKIYWVNLVQPYAGGGTYGGNQFQYISWEYAGCPAGK